MGTDGQLPYSSGKGNVIVNGTFEASGSVSINGLSGSGTVRSSSDDDLTLAVGYNDQSSTFSGLLEDGDNHLSLEKYGSGTLILTNRANSYTGGTWLYGGTVCFSSGSLGSSNVLFEDDSTLQWASGNTQDISSNLSVSSGVSVATLEIDGSNTVTFASSLGGGSAKLIKAGGGTLILASNASFSGGVEIDAGTLQVGNGGTTGGLSSGSNHVTVAEDAALVFNRSNNYTFSRIIDGDGSVAEQGTGTLTLSGANTYSGGTTISSGVLEAANTTSLLGLPGYTSSDLSIASGATLAVSSANWNDSQIATLVDNWAFGSHNLGIDVASSSRTLSSITGDMGLVKLGAGTLTLSGENDYAGGTIVQAGTLVLDDDTGNCLSTSPSYATGGQDCPSNKNLRSILAKSFHYICTNSLIRRRRSWQGDSEAVEQDLLGLVRFGDAPQPDGAAIVAGSGGGRQHHVAALDLGQFLQHRARRVAQAGPPHPLGQRLPQHVRQETHQDVRLHPVGLLMPDRADFQFVFGDPKRPFRLGQLDVTFPQHGRIGLGQVRPQQVTALGERGPIAPAVVARPGHAQPGLPLWRRQTLDLHVERSGRPPVLPHQPAQPPIGHRFVPQPSALGRCLHLAERRLQAIDEPLVHGLFLLAAIHAAGQHERLIAFRARHQLHLHALLHFAPVLPRQIFLELPQHGLGRAHDVLARRAAAKTPGSPR